MYIHQNNKNKRQKENHYQNHHPKEKKAQLIRIKDLIRDKTVLEVFGGRKNISSLYMHIASELTTLTFEETGDSYNIIKEWTDKVGYKSKKYNVIDIDGYGFSLNLFPHIFKLLKPYGTLIYTAPRQNTIISDTRRDMFEEVFSTRNWPRMDEIMDTIGRFAKEYNLELIRNDCFEVNSGYKNRGGITRQVFRVRKQKS